MDTYAKTAAAHVKAQPADLASGHGRTTGVNSPWSWPSVVPGPSASTPNNGSSPVPPWRVQQLLQPEQCCGIAHNQLGDWTKTLASSLSFPPQHPLLGENKFPGGYASIYGPVVHTSSVAFGAQGPYARDHMGGSGQSGVDPRDPFANFYSVHGIQDDGRMKMRLKSKQDGSMPNDAEVIAMAKTSPSGDVFVVDESKQIEYRTPEGKVMGQAKGNGKGKPYAMIFRLLIKGRRECEKGNVTVYMRTGQVLVNCSMKLRPIFMHKISEWVESV